jgi:hypothetical protein
MSTPPSSANLSDRAELGFRLLAQRLDLGAIGKIGRKDVDALAKFGGQGFQLFDPRPVQAHSSALGVQHAGDLLAQSAGRAGHQCLAAGQIKHGPVPSMFFCSLINREWLQAPPRYRPAR